MVSPAASASPDLVEVSDHFITIGGYRATILNDSKFTDLGVTDNNIMLQHVPGADNPADLFTKPLPKSEFAKHVATILNDDKLSELEWVSCFYDRS